MKTLKNMRILLLVNCICLLFIMACFRPVKTENPSGRTVYYKLSDSVDSIVIGKRIKIEKDWWVSIVDSTNDNMRGLWFHIYRTNKDSLPHLSLQWYTSDSMCNDGTVALRKETWFKDGKKYKNYVDMYLLYYPNTDYREQERSALEEEGYNPDSTTAMQTYNVGYYDNGNVERTYWSLMIKDDIMFEKVVTPVIRYPKD